MPLPRDTPFGPLTFEVDFSFRDTPDAPMSRQRVGGTTTSLYNSTSDFAVQTWLQERHPGKMIQIYRIDWY